MLSIQQLELTLKNLLCVLEMGNKVVLYPHPYKFDVSEMQGRWAHVARGFLIEGDPKDTTQLIVKAIKAKTSKFDVWVENGGTHRAQFRLEQGTTRISIDVGPDLRGYNSLHILLESAIGLV